MKVLSIVIVLFSTTIIFSCKKNTLVEQVDVPATPIEVVKVEGGSSKVSDVKAIEGLFKMYPLPFEYKDLEPHFDAATVEIHYSKHHLNCVNNLNRLVVGTKYEIMSLTDIFKNLNLSDTEVRNNAGGFYNHNFFWENLKVNDGTEPEGELMNSIIRDFGTFDEFKNQFTAISNQSFGSGFTWLISDKFGKLSIIFIPNNDNPLMRGLGNSGIPLLNLDLWEHAYYLKFQNRKKEYINTFFNVINWENVSKKYEAIPNKSLKITKPAISESVTVIKDSI